jgi:hypothetical protein
MPATFDYAGINVERCGLFTGVRGKQISARSVLVHTGPFPYGDEWRSLVASLEAALRLYEHPRGTLTRNAKYLHQRTGGSICSLSQLVRTAALSAWCLAPKRSPRICSTTPPSTTLPNPNTPHPRAATAT